MEPDKEKSSQGEDSAQEKNNPTDNDTSNSSNGDKNQDLQSNPSDALSRTPEDLKEEQSKVQSSESTGKKSTVKKPSSFRLFLRRINVYFLLFLLIVVIVAAVSVVNYLNSQKEPVVPDIATQKLTKEALKQLANTDATIGDSSQTLTIQGSAVIAGQTLMRGDLDVAGNFQAGGSIQGTELTISGSTNLKDTQISNLQVAQNFAVQGATSLRELSVSGSATISGPLTASKLTVSNIVLSGSGNLEIPSHIKFTGPAPSRSLNQNALGGGGSASVSGSDITGTVNINTGNNPAAGCLVTIGFATPFSKQPHVNITPIGVAAGQMTYYVERDGGGFSICAATPAPNNRSFAFDYFITS